MSDHVGSSKNLKDLKRDRKQVLAAKAGAIALHDDVGPSTHTYIYKYIYVYICIYFIYIDIYIYKIYIDIY